jgi:nicotinamide-nucleotide amidase
MGKRDNALSGFEKKIPEVQAGHHIGRNYRRPGIFVKGSACHQIKCYRGRLVVLKVPGIDPQKQMGLVYPAPQEYRKIHLGLVQLLPCYNTPAREQTMAEKLEITIGLYLRKRGLKLAVAESCTGGLLADHITDVPGSSDYFVGGVVAYSYEAKVALLHVSWDTLRLYGAVSRATVVEMARGVRTALGADIGVSVSGIAGPAGGLPDKPVGTTWIGLSARDGDWGRKFVWEGDRRLNKESSAQAALQLVLDYFDKKLENG